MTRPAPLHPMEFEALARAAEAMFGSAEAGIGSLPEHPEILVRALQWLQARGGPEALEEMSIEPRHASPLPNDSPNRVAAAADAHDVAPGDCDDLMRAVIDRLRRAVLPPPAAPAPMQGARVRTSVLECASALDQLRSTLAHELARLQALEQQMRDDMTGASAPLPDDTGRVESVRSGVACPGDRAQGPGVCQGHPAPAAWR